jgi:hypothetical protein
MKKISHNGLLPQDEKLLKKRLDDLKPVFDRIHLLGGAEAGKAYELRRRLQNRLSPEDPDALSTDALAFTDQFVPQLREAIDRMKERRAEAEQLQAERQREQDEHFRAVAYRIEAEERRLAGLAVDEVL